MVHLDRMARMANQEKVDKLEDRFKGNIRLSNHLELLDNMKILRKLKI